MVDAFSRRLEGEIAPSLCAKLESHLQGCPACRARCDSLRATLTLSRGACAAPVPPDVESTVREALRRFLAKQE